MNRGRLIRVAGKLVAGIALVGMLSTCDLFNGPDILKRVSGDVSKATAKDLVLTIVDDSSGTTTPSGVLTMKEGFGVDIEAVANSKYVLVGWKKTSGSGTPTYEKVSFKKVNVKITGGPVTIAPVYELRPLVESTTPVGNNVGKNVNVRVNFNRPILQSSAANNKVALYKDGSTLFAMDQVFASGGSTVYLNHPGVTKFNDFTNYLVIVDGSVAADINFDNPIYQGMFLMNSSVTVGDAQKTQLFQVYSSDDLSNPSIGSFSIVGTTDWGLYSLPNGTSATDNYYTKSTSVSLTNILSGDDSGVKGMYVSNASNGTAQTWFDYTSDSMTLPSSWALSGSTAGVYPVYMIFKDVSNNIRDNTVTGNYATASTILDNTPPTGSFTIANSGGWTGSRSPTLTLSFADQTIGGKQGSGDSVDGLSGTGHSQERKQVYLTNTNPSSPAYIFVPYATTINKTYIDSYSSGLDLLSTTNGSQLITIAVLDGVGNYNFFSTSVSLDTVAPTVSHSPVSGSYYTVSPTSVGITLVATDSGSGLSGGSAGLVVSGDLTNTTITPYILGVSQTPITASGGTYTMSYVPDKVVVNLAAGADGKRTVNFHTTDRVGNATDTSIDLYLDTTGPVPGSPAVRVGGTTTSPSSRKATSSSGVKLTLLASDAYSGLYQVGIATVIGGAAAPVIGSAVWQAYSGLVSYTLPSSQNNYDIYVWFKDNLGNNSATPSIAYVTLDTTPPNGALSSTPTSTAATGITFSVQSSDASAGNNIRVRVSNDNTTFTQIGTLTTTAVTPITTWVTNWDLISGAGGSATNGTRTIYVAFLDPAGNSTVLSFNVVFDNTPPTLSYINAWNATSSSWYAAGSGTVDLYFSASDNVTANSSASFQMRFSNNNSTWTSWQQYNVSGYLAGWNMLSGNGGTSGEGSKLIYMQVQDALGNVASANWTIVYDITAPSLSGALLYVGGSGNPTTLVSRTTSLYYSMPADATGVAAVRLSNDNSNWSGWYSYPNTTYNVATTGTQTGWVLPQLDTAVSSTKQVYAQFKDAAGNTSTTLNDATPPSLAIGTSQSYGVGLTYTEIATATSGTSQTTPYSSYMTTGYKTLTAGKSYAFKTSNGNYGVYYVYSVYYSGTASTSYVYGRYSLWNSAGTALATNSWFYYYLSTYRMDFDLGAQSTTYISGVTDFGLYYSSGVWQIYSYSGAVQWN